MLIRWAKEQDREAFIDIYSKNFGLVDNQVSETAQDLFEEKLSNPLTGLVLLAEEGDKIVGIVAVDILELTGHIVGLAVLKDHQRKGIGTALVKSVIETMPKISRNIRHLVLTGGTPTVRIAQKFGFISNDVVWVKYI